jgi:hypothetical protein
VCVACGDNGSGLPPETIRAEVGVLYRSETHQLDPTRIARSRWQPIKIPTKAFTPGYRLDPAKQVGSPDCVRSRRRWAGGWRLLPAVAHTATTLD